MQETQDTIPGLGRFAGVGNGNPLQYSCLESHGQRSLVRYSPWGDKELDMTEHSYKYINCKLYVDDYLYVFHTKGIISSLLILA